METRDFYVTGEMKITEGFETIIPAVNAEDAILQLKGYLPDAEEIVVSEAYPLEDEKQAKVN